MISTLKKRTLEYLARSQASDVTTKDLARRLKLRAREEYQQLRSLIAELERDGVVSVDGRGRIHYIRQHQAPRQRAHRLIGQLTVDKRGVGRVKIEGSEDEIKVAPSYMRTALHGDTVAVAPFARPLTRRKGMVPGPVEGEIVEIVRRRLTSVTGTLKESRNFSFVVPDDERITRDIYVSREEAGNAKDGDKVVVQLLPWDNEHLNPEGKIIEVLGPSGDARVEVMSVARSFGLPLSFPDDVVREGDRLSSVISADDLSGRLDYRNVPCITIDPMDAKDFDDAVSIEPLDDGLMRLGVHIADVSHYVPAGSALDLEAYARGTSVYMVNEVIPMLPERLSNHLCSLQPHVDRLAFSVLMDLHADGNVVQYVIRKSVIHSVRRFTYEEVQRIIERGDGEHAQIILPLHRLSQVLLKRRRKNGSIDFDTGEVKIAFDASGLPSKIMKQARLDAHRLVEECMLLANRTVAEHIGRVKRATEVRPFVYRVHDLPKPDRIQDLASFVRQFGYSLDAKGGVSSRELQKLLDQVRGTEVENVISEVALRSMAKAVYSEKNIGHYGLAFKLYTHFTSPIRRYPDLVVHRLLQEYEIGVSPHRLEELRELMPEVARQSSERERIAQEAERASVRVMQVEYMKRHLGDEFEGVITGVTDFGLFVEVNDLLVQGLVSMRDLADDYYLYDEKRYSLRGRSRGKVYRLGDPVRVRVVSIDSEKHEIDFAIAE